MLCSVTLFCALQCQCLHINSASLLLAILSQFLPLLVPDSLLQYCMFLLFPPLTVPVSLLNYRLQGSLLLCFPAHAEHEHCCAKLASYMYHEAQLADLLLIMQQVGAQTWIDKSSLYVVGF